MISFELLIINYWYYCCYSYYYYYYYYEVIVLFYFIISYKNILPNCGFSNKEWSSILAAGIEAKSAESTTNLF